MPRRMSPGGCSNPPNCPRFAESDPYNVVFQGYPVDASIRPASADPPDGEVQISMPREAAFRIARSILSLDEELPEVPGLLDGWEHTLFRLEAQQQYLVDEEAEQIRAWLAGDLVPDWSPEVERWRQHLRDSVASGQRWQRVHVVDVPLTNYLRFELAQYPSLAEIGYETLIADRSRHPELTELTEDFYLCDGDEDNPFALLMRYDDKGRYLSMWRMDDPPIIEACRRRQQLALQHAEPLDEFTRRMNRKTVVVT